MKLFTMLRRAWSRHDERLADEAVQGDRAVDLGGVAEGEYDAMRAGGLLGPRSDVLDEIESSEPD
jgi:hypothetical protein